MGAARKIPMEATQQTVRFFETVLRASSDGIVITDAAQNIVVVNESFCAVFNERHRNIVETSLFIWLNQLEENAAVRWGELEKQVRLEGSAGNINFTSTIGGNSTHLSVNASLLDRVGNEEIGVIISVWRDVTEQVETAKQLEQYACQLKKANDEVRRFAYIVSHDFRAPLVSINAFSRELKSAVSILEPIVQETLSKLPAHKSRAVAEAINEDIPEAIEYIGGSVKELGQFIEALLKLSRLGRQELHPESVEVTPVVENAVQLLKHQIEQQQCKVIVGELPEVTADPIALAQIVGNIIGNAVKYLKPGRPGKIKITARKQDHKTLFSISDNGRGIAPEQMINVFAPFRRAGAPDTVGEGMGLAYVETLVKRHGGQITCESELNKGTCFTFSLPGKTQN